MGRSPKFDESEVLALALDVFWREGYAGASARLLQEHIGANPGSLYHHFGSKETLFLKVVDFYIEVVVSQRIHDYLCGNDARRGVEEFFATSFDGPSPGCLLCNCAAEFGVSHDKVLGRLHKANHMLIDGFLGLLLRDDRFNTNNDNILRRKAQGLLIAFQGYLVVGKTLRDAKERKGYYRGVLDGLLEQN